VQILEAGSAFSNRAAETVGSGVAFANLKRGGPVYDFLELVLKPLRAHLRDKLLAPVTTETIVRRITEDFPKAS